MHSLCVWKEIMPKKTIRAIKARVFKDARGIVVFPAAAMARRLKAGNLKDFHIATLKPGAVRGNHVHPHHDEYLICIGSGGAVVIRHNGRNKTLRPRNATVNIPKGVPHAVINRGTGDLTVACFYGPSPRRLTRTREEVI